MRHRGKEVEHADHPELKVNQLSNSRHGAHHVVDGTRRNFATLAPSPEVDLHPPQHRQSGCGSLGMCHERGVRSLSYLL